MDSRLGFNDFRGFDRHQYENNEPEPRSKRAPDFVRPDSDAKYIKRHELDMPKSIEHSRPVTIPKEIVNAVAGSQLLNASKSGKDDDAIVALSKITSHVAFLIFDAAGNTVFEYASPNVREEILKKLGRFNVEAERKNDFRTLDEIDQGFDLDVLQDLSKYC